MSLQMHECDSRSVPVGLLAESVTLGQLLFFPRRTSVGHAPVSIMPSELRKRISFVYYRQCESKGIDSACNFTIICPVIQRYLLISSGFAYLLKQWKYGLLFFFSGYLLLGFHASYIYMYVSCRYNLNVVTTAQMIYCMYL